MRDGEAIDEREKEMKRNRQKGERKLAHKRLSLHQRERKFLSLSLYIWFR